MILENIPSKIFEFRQQSRKHINYINGVAVKNSWQKFCLYCVVSSVLIPICFTFEIKLLGNKPCFYLSQSITDGGDT